MSPVASASSGASIKRSEMKTAHYDLLDGSSIDVDYDPDVPCIRCGLPVFEASVGGTVVCPWCDCGVHRDGTKWTLKDAVDFRSKINRGTCP